MKNYILKYQHTINVLKKNKVTREKKLQKYNIEKSPMYDEFKFNTSLHHLGF